MKYKSIEDAAKGVFGHLAEWDTSQSYKGVPIDQLRVAFDSICHKADWKKQINAIIATEKADIAVKAIEFFAGCDAQVRKSKGRNVRITAPGYYARLHHDGVHGDVAG